MSQYERQFFEYFKILDRKLQVQPLVLGGITASGGGIGYPPGGYSGQLPQTQVCYDLSEEATLDTAPSGESLLDNLNHIRYRIGTLEALAGSGSGGGGSTALSIYDDGILQGTVSEIDFTTNLAASVLSSRATISLDIDPIIVVSSDGSVNMYSTSDVQDVFDNSIDGDTIYLPGGSFNLSPVVFDLKNVSIIGIGSSKTILYISGGESDQWCFSATYDNYYHSTVYKGFSIYATMEYEFSSYNIAGVMKVEISNAITMEDIIIQADCRTYNTSISSTVYYYGLYFDSGDIYPPSEYSNIIVFRNIAVQMFSRITYTRRMYLEVIGMYVKAPVIEYPYVYVNIDQGLTITGISMASSLLSNPYVDLYRDDCEYNGKVIGITNQLPSSGSWGSPSAYIIKNPILNLYDYTDGSDSGKTETHGFRLGYGDDGDIVNPRVNITIDSSDASDSDITSVFTIISQSENFTISQGLAKIFSDRSIVNKLSNVYYIYNNPNDFNTFIDVYNSSLTCIDSTNNNPVELGSNYSDAYIRKHNTLFGTKFYNQDDNSFGDVIGGNYSTIDASGNIILHGTASIISSGSGTYPKGIDVYDNTVSKGSFEKIDFGDNLSVEIDGDTATINATAGSGGGSSIDIYENSVLKGSVTTLNFSSNFDVTVTDDEADIDVNYGSGGGGNIATDSIWDAKGDLIIGSGSNSASILPISVNDGYVLTSNSSASLGISWSPSSTYIDPGGRLTLSSGVPVTTSDVNNATKIYYTAYKHDGICLYDGSKWGIVTFTEPELDISSFTASKPYDIFGYLSSNTLALEGLVWTDATNRATAITYQNGRYVKSGDATRLYLGTIYMAADQKCDDSYTTRYVWNNYNRLRRNFFKVDTTAHSYTTAAWRYWNNSSTNKIEFVCGVLEEGININFVGISDSYGIMSATMNGSNGDAYTIGNNDISLNATTTTGFRHGASNTFNPNLLGYWAVTVMEYGQSNADFTNYRLSGYIKG